MRDAVTSRLALEVAARALAEDVPGAEPSEADLAALAHLLSGGQERLLRARLAVGVPLVAVGAPAAAWFPRVHRLLDCKLVVPMHAEVANAYGALVGRVLERAVARVKAEPDETFVVVTPDAQESYPDYPSARTRAEEIASSAALAAAAAAGAPDASVTITHDEVVARGARPGEDVIVELTVLATAAGPPFLAETDTSANKGARCPSRSIP